RRSEVYDLLLNSDPDASEILEITRAAAAVPSDASLALLWRVLGSDSIDEDAVAVVYRSLQEAYLGRRMYDPSSRTAAQTKRVVEAAQPRAESGSDTQRVVALALLLTVDAERAVGIATKLLKDDELGEQLRLDTFTVVLLGLPEPEASKAAIEALKGDREDPDTLRLALRFLAAGRREIMGLRDNRLFVPRTFSEHGLGPDSSAELA